MSVVNSVLRPLFDLIQAPLAGLPPMVGIVLWSIPVGVFALLVFKWTSNQEAIAEVKRRIHGSLFEIRLFNDDLRAILRAQGRILRDVARYQLLALKPMIFILPPLVLVMVHLHQYYGFRPLHPADEVLLEVVLADVAVGAARPDIELDLPAGLETTTPAVWSPAIGAVAWRLAAREAGSYEVGVKLGAEVVTKTVAVSDRVVRLSPERPPSTFVDQLEWPSEPPVPDGSAIRAILLAYPEGGVSLGGWAWEWSFAWMVVFFVLTMVVAVALRKPLGVGL